LSHLRLKARSLGLDLQSRLHPSIKVHSQLLLNCTAPTPCNCTSTLCTGLSVWYGNKAT